MKRYYVSIDLDVAGIEAESEEEALQKAEEYIRDGGYSLQIVDRDNI